MNPRTKRFSDNRRGAHNSRPRLELLEARIAFNTDFGDAPLPYKTLLAEGGASHNAVGPMLGVNRDTEADGIPSAAADGDDTTGAPNDEDGVTFGTIRAGQLGAAATVRVGGGSAMLNAWIDFNQDGSWGGPGEHVLVDRSVVVGDNSVVFDVPSWAIAGATYARFRVSSAGALGPAGPAQNGEVEDYLVPVLSPKPAPGIFSGHTISTGADSAKSVFAIDVDADGDMDVLSASALDDRIAWYENDGNQNFTAHTITAAADSAQSVHAADVDGDGDVDVLSASESDNRIAWYENDGSQNFVTRNISVASTGANSVLATDVDADGDMDVVSSSRIIDTIAWHENDGNQSFTTRIITTHAERPHKVYAADMDGDGDLDILSASFGDNKIAWYENNGSQVFTTRVITIAATGATSVFAADVDHDGDIDALSAASGDGSIAWHENDGNQNFTTRTISTSAGFGFSVYAADMDGDGDTDVLSATSTQDKIAWHENDGNQNFTTRTISVGAIDSRSVYAADVDGDGDLDVLSASAADDKIAWYESRRAKNVGLSSDDSPDPTSMPLPIPAPQLPTRQVRSTSSGQPSRARSESSSGVSPARQLGCPSCPAPTAGHIARLGSPDVALFDAFFVDFGLEERLTFGLGACFQQFSPEERLT